MRSQDDIAFQSQQFASEISGRRNQIAQHQAGLNMQAGQLSAQFIEQMRAQQRHQAEMAGDAVNLGQDQLELQQATEELAWARQLRSDRMLANALKQSDAQTDLAVAQAREQRMKIGGGDVPGVTNEDRLYALANGVSTEWNDTAGNWDLSKDKAPKERQDWAKSILQGRQAMNQSRFANREARQPGKYDEVETLAKAIDSLSLSAPELASELESVVRKSLGLSGGGQPQPAKTDNVPTQQAKAQPSIQWLGEKNARSVYEFVSKPEEVAQWRKAFMSTADPNRKYELTDQQVIDRVMSYLQSPDDPRGRRILMKMAEGGMLPDTNFTLDKDNRMKFGDR